MVKGLGGLERERQHRTHSGCDCLSSGALLPGPGSQHLQQSPTTSPRGCKAASRPTSIPDWCRSTPAPPEPPPAPAHRAAPAGFGARHHHLPAPGLVTDLPAPWGHTCQLSLLGEVGRAGAAGDTYERGRHLGVPAIDIHVTAGHGELKGRGTGGSAPSRAVGLGLKPSCSASRARVRSPGRCNCLPGPLKQL